MLHSSNPQERRADNAWLLVMVLVMTATLAYIDRQMFSLFAQEIKQDLNLTDTELGTLQGLAFSLFYGVMSYPIARFADSRSRKKIISIAVIFWSIMAVATAFSKSFVSMFFIRAGTASGEAGLSPSASSMITDVFPRTRLALPISIYSLSIYFGSGIAFMIGALIHNIFGGAVEVTLPLLGEMQVWRLAFIIAGLLGLPWTFILLKWLKEPKRMQYSKDGEIVSASNKKATYSDILSYLNEHRTFFITFLLGFTFILGAVNAVFSWTPTILIRIFEIPVSEVGFVFGFIFVISGISGSLAAGFLSNTSYIATKKGGLLLLSLMSTVGLIICQLLASITLSETAYIILAGLSIFFIAPVISLPPAIIQTIAPSNMRAQMIALFIMFTGAVGIGTGPIIVGVITDYIFADPMTLHHAVSLSTFVLCLMGIACILIALSSYKKQFTTGE